MINIVIESRGERKSGWDSQAMCLVVPVAVQGEVHPTGRQSQAPDRRAGGQRGGRYPERRDVHSGKKIIIM